MLSDLLCSFDQMGLRKDGWWIALFLLMWATAVSDGRGLAFIDLPDSLNRSKYNLNLTHEPEKAIKILFASSSPRLFFFFNCPLCSSFLSQSGPRGGRCERKRPGCCLKGKTCHPNSWIWSLPLLSIEHAGIKNCNRLFTFQIFISNWMILRVDYCNLLSVWHFSYEIDDDYTALYKGMVAESLLKAVALSQSALLFFWCQVWSLFYSAWGLKIP